MNPSEKPEASNDLSVTHGSLPVLLVPRGLVAKIESAANGFRTKREVATLFAAQGLTYEMVRGMAEGAVKTEERDKLKTCRYASLANGRDQRGPTPDDKQPK